ncbi:MAG TPA: polysaccharide deacetylase family protein [Nocardioides sp.]|uniref:polysaccharide deacetylase family protein n=1 Tax=Nocardioides sp. TaxID=35761 RepID=UPI002D7E3CD3|nr:polysaccharide deacetylase family protein [Nocardioides sp.]HET6651382.1 polysaccharide deacetylase family protein [Nocardioides sp.]
MTGWLDPLRAVLDSAERPVTFFFRDDDAGWDDEALAALLDVFGTSGVPLDVAAIPEAMSPHTVDLLASRRESGRNDLTVHQHGLAHVNHEPEGRKCEFGPSRSAEQQADDIARGRDLLHSMMGDLPAVFTPPWNRCAPWTAEVLRDLGFAVLSRDLSAGLAGVDGLVELPITVDWYAKRTKVPVDRAGRGELLAESAAGPGPVGLMLHHEVMGEDDRADLADLLDLVAGHTAAATDHLDRLALTRVR